MECPFCDLEVIKKQLLFENENIYVLHNIRPANKGQCIIIPKRHVINIRELNKKELIDIITTVQYISSRYNKRFKLEGLNYGFNEGQYSGQMTEHFHFHIMPRIKSDKDKLPKYHLFHRDPKTKKNLLPKELKIVVEEIKDLLS